MKKITLLFVIALSMAKISTAQIDLSKLDASKIFGKVLNVKKGFAPKFFLGKQPIPKIIKVAEVIGFKHSAEATKLFNTFRTGRTIYKTAAYLGSVISLYGTIKAIDKAAAKKDYQGAIVGGVTTVATGLIVKFLTKGAAYKAVDIFNGIVRKKIKDILSVAPSSQTMGVGLYVKL